MNELSQQIHLHTVSAEKFKNLWDKSEKTARESPEPFFFIDVFIGGKLSEESFPPYPLSKTLS